MCRMLDEVLSKIRQQTNSCKRKGVKFMQNALCLFALIKSSDGRCSSLLSEQDCSNRHHSVMNKFPTR